MANEASLRYLQEQSLAIDEVEKRLSTILEHASFQPDKKLNAFGDCWEVVYFVSNKAAAWAKISHIVKAIRISESAQGILIQAGKRAPGATLLEHRGQDIEFQALPSELKVAVTEVRGKFAKVNAMCTTIRSRSAAANKVVVSHMEMVLACVKPVISAHAPSKTPLPEEIEKFKAATDIAAAMLGQMILVDESDESQLEMPTRSTATTEADEETEETVGEDSSST